MRRVTERIGNGTGRVILALAAVSAALTLVVVPLASQSAPVIDNSSGTWTDALDDDTGISSSLDTAVSDSSLELSESSPAKWTLTTQDDWNAGSLARIEAQSEPGSVKLVHDAYAETLIDNAFSEIGDTKSWNGDDSVWTLALPFSFRLYGTDYTTAYVSSNGYVVFDSPFSDYEPSEPKLADHAMIAPLWEDMRTSGSLQANEDVYVSETASRVVIRWVGETVFPARPVNFSLELNDDGTIRLHYGAGNDVTDVSHLVGVSKGDGATYMLSKLNSLTSLESAKTAEMTFFADYAPDGSFTSADFDAGASESPKVFERLSVRTAPLPPGTSVDVYYSVDGGAYALAGTHDTDDATEAVFLLAGATGQEIALRADLATTDDLTGPVLEELQTSYVFSDGSWLQTSQSDFLTGNLDGLDASQSPGKLMLAGAHGYVEDLSDNVIPSGGTAQGWIGDDQVWYYELPFDFTLYGSTYGAAYVSSNGYIHFGYAYNNYGPSHAALAANPIVAPMWADLLTGGGAQPGEDIYVSTPDADTVIFRWVGEFYATGRPANFAAVLHRGGRIEFQYGTGNDSLYSVNYLAGVSSGNGSDYLVSSLSGQTSLNLAQTAGIYDDASYQDSGTFTSAVFDAGTPDDNKLLVGLEWEKAIDPGAQISLEYMLDENGEWTGPDATGSIIFPASTVAKAVRYKLNFNASPDLRGTPYLESAKLTYKTRAPVGSATSVDIVPDAVALWSTLTYHTETPTGTAVSVDVMGLDDSVLKTDVPSGTSLSDIDPGAHGGLKLHVTLGSEDTALTPRLKDWSVTWDPHEPTVDVSAPGAGDTVSDTVTITYTADDPDSGGAALVAEPVSLFWSRDGGSTWYAIDSSVANDGTYEWNTRHVPDSANFRVKVEARDGYGLVGEATTGAFTVQNAPSPPSDPNPPAVTIVQPTADVTWHGVQTVVYTATDPDTGVAGLLERPIGLYYSSDGGTVWYRMSVGQANSGEYAWDTHDVADGDDYRVRVMALDGYYVADETVSGRFAIDNGAPDFRVQVSADPAGPGPLTINVVASEPLEAPPSLTVAQNGAAPSDVAMSGSGSNFTGTYVVTTGHDGQATIAITGTDLVGNVGTDIESGGTFMVDATAPDEPVLSQPTEGQVFTAGSIVVAGSAEPYSTVVLMVNDETVTSQSTGSSGTFYFPSVPISSTFDHGHNRVSVRAVDPSGNRSPATTRTVTCNRPPEAAITYPTAGVTLKGYATLTWTGDDFNQDHMTYTMRHSDDGGETWTKIKDFTGTGAGHDAMSYRWYTPSVADGSDYRLKVTVSDGTQSSSVVSPSFRVDNNLPAVTIDALVPNRTNDRTPTFTGRAVTTTDRIELIQWTLNSGATWYSAVPVSGEFHTRSEYFRITTYTLSEGTYTIKARAKDAKGNYTAASRWGHTTFVIDLTPPGAPTIGSPSAGQVIPDSGDVNSGQAGVQVNVSGSAEGNSVVTLHIGSRTYSSRAGADRQYQISNVTLAHGQNTLYVTATDIAGNTSGRTSRTVTANNPPAVSILSPRGDTWSKKHTVRWSVSDPDRDPITNSSAEVTNRGGWSGIGGGATTRRAELNTKNFSDGGHSVRVKATDGVSEGSATSSVTVDNTAPKIRIFKLVPNPTNDGRPTLYGLATDNLAGMKYVEYSIDGGSWYKAVLLSGSGGTKSRYRFRHQENFVDGDHVVRTRATDMVDNVGYSKTMIVMVDTKAPAIGGNMVSYGQQVLLPDGTGTIEIVAGGTQEIAVAVGGDPERVEVTIGDRTILLKYDAATGLWKGSFSADAPGQFDVTVRSYDTLGNQNERQVASLLVDPYGRVFDASTGDAVKGAQVTLYFLEPSTKGWVSWDGAAYGQQNPRTTDAEGSYSFQVPGGQYYMTVTANGYEPYSSPAIVVAKNKPVNTDVRLARTSLASYFKPSVVMGPTGGSGVTRALVATVAGLVIILVLGGAALRLGGRR